MPESRRINSRLSTEPGRKRVSQHLIFLNLKARLINNREGLTATESIKQEAYRLLERLPDKATWVVAVIRGARLLADEFQKLIAATLLVDTEQTPATTV